MEMEWFKFHKIWSKGLHDLSDAEAGRFTKAVCDFQDTGEIQSLSGNERFLFSIALEQMKQDADHIARVSSVRAEARRGKGLRQKEMITNDNNSYQLLSKENKNNNSSIKNKEIRNKNKEEELINICAEAHDSAPEKPKLTPNDHEFWKFAKENAELAEAFYKASGLYPIGNQFGRWVNDLKNFHEAGITVQQMQAAVQKIRREGRITISAPGSVFTTARDISLGGSSGRIVTQPKPQNKTAYEMLEEMGIV